MRFLVILWPPTTKGPLKVGSVTLGPLSNTMTKKVLFKIVQLDSTAGKHNTKKSMFLQGKKSQIQLMKKFG